HELDRCTRRNALDAVIDVVGVFDGTVHHEVAPGDAHLLARAEEGHGRGARCRVRAAADPVAGDDHGLRAPGVVWGVALGEVDAGTVDVDEHVARAHHPVGAQHADRAHLRSYADEGVARYHRVDGVLAGPVGEGSQPDRVAARARARRRALEGAAADLRAAQSVDRD